MTRYYISESEDYPVFGLEDPRGDGGSFSVEVPAEVEARYEAALDIWNDSQAELKKLHEKIYADLPPIKEDQ